MTDAHSGPGAAGKRTLAELLCYLPTQEQRNELESYRFEYDQKHGPTDFTKRYTSTWPTHLQRYLYEFHPQRWFDGLPPFAQAFFAEKSWSLLSTGAINKTNERDLRSNWIKTGPKDDDRIDRYWIDQYLRQPVRSPDSDGRDRA